MSEPRDQLAAVHCRKCGRDLPAAAFRVTAGGRLRKPCRACVAARNRAYWHGHPDFAAQVNARRRAARQTRLAPEDRFWAKVDRNPGGCWGWTGTTIRGGYGHFGTAGRRVLAHRFSYELASGPIPDGLFVLHRCDNPRCVNPEHLFLGTQADNMRDMASKGRSGCDRGESHHRSRLTEGQVREIRRLRRDGVPAATVAAKFGVSRGCVHGIQSGKSWRHVGERAAS